MFKLPTVKDYDNYVAQLKALDDSLEKLVTDVAGRRDVIKRELDAISNLKSTLEEYEKKSAPILRHYDSRSGKSDGHDIRRLSDGSIVCTSCPAAVLGNKDCWAVKDYCYRNNAFSNHNDVFSSEAYDPFSLRSRLPRSRY